MAELTAAGVPSVLVPFPYATHDHQTRNAEILAACGAALLAPEKDIATLDVAGMLIRLFDEPETLRRMGQAARCRALPDAAARVVEELALLCGESAAASAERQSADSKL